MFGSRGSSREDEPHLHTADRHADSPLPSAPVVHVLTVPQRAVELPPEEVAERVRGHVQYASPFADTLEGVV